MSGIKGERMEGSIRVTTQRLKEKSGEWEGLTQEAASLLLGAKEEMERMEDCFDAKALCMLQKAFGEQAGAGIRQLELLKEQVEKLVYMAAGYEEAEAANEDSIPKN